MGKTSEAIATDTPAPEPESMQQVVSRVLQAALARRHSDAIRRGRPRFTTNERLLVYTAVTDTLWPSKEQFLELERWAGEEDPEKRFAELSAEYAANHTDTPSIADDLALQHMQYDRVEREVRAAYDLGYTDFGEPLSRLDDETRDELAAVAGQVLLQAATELFLRQETLA